MENRRKGRKSVISLLNVLFCCWTVAVFFGCESGGGVAGVDGDADTDNDTDTDT